MRSVGLLGLGVAPVAAAVIGSLPPVIDPFADLFFDDFNGTNSSLTGRSGWSAFGDATKAGKIVSDGGFARMLTGFNGDAPWGYQVSSADPGAAKLVEFEYDFSQQGATLSDAATPFKNHDQQFILGWSAATDYTYATFDRPTTTWRMRIYSVVGNAAPVVVAIYIGLPATAVVQVRMTDRWRVRVNGRVWAPDQLFNDALASYPDRLIGASVIKSGGAGFRHSFHPVAFSKFLRVNPVDITIANPNAGYGRDATGNRDIAFSGTYVGTPASWAWRLRSAVTGTATTQWASMTPTAAAGSWSVTLKIPTGAHVMDVAWIDAGGKAHITTSTVFAVGIHVMWWGQSNSAGAANTQAVWLTGDNPLVVGRYGGAAFAGSSYDRWWSDADLQVNTYMPNCAGLARSLSAATGLPVIVSGKGVTATELALLKPGTSNWNNVLVPHVNAMGGNVEHWVWSQGEAEALSLSSYSNYAADFALLVDGLRSIGARPDAGVFVRLIGQDNNVTVNSTTTTRAAGFRALQMTLENPANRVWIASHPLGIPLSDNIHFSGLGQVDLTRREGLTIARRIYGALSYDGRGPFVTGATRVGAVITLSVDLNGAASISGSALTGYSVTTDDFATTRAISSVNVSGNTIVITLAADPGGPVKIASYREANYDDSSIAVGSYADGTTIPVMPIAAPITAT